MAAIWSAVNMRSGRCGRPIEDPDEWHVTATALERSAVDPEGRTITIRDAVLHAVRRAAGSRPR